MHLRFDHQHHGPRICGRGPSGSVLGEIRPSASSGKRRRYFVQDLLGSVRAVVAENGTVLEARDYYAWGLQMPGRQYDTTGGSGSASEDYTGHELDEVTGLHYAGARYYSLPRPAGTRPRRGG